MNASLLPGIFEDEHIRVICWTLIHSLWIGLIAAALAGVMLVCTQKSSSQLRYRLLCGCLIIFVLITSFVFYQESRSFDRVSKVTAASYRIIPTVPSLSEYPVALNDIDILTQSTSFINQNSVWIFTIWFLCFAFKILSLANGLFYVHRIRSYKVHQVSGEWQERIKNYAEHLGIRQSISLLQSELVKVPVTVGHFKPVILIPIGLIFQLPAQQIETILIHELAHIRRRDYLVNILQSLLETIFFFNPGLLWLSSLIREEREICCDDIVLANTSVKSNYLEALLAFHSQQPARSDLVLGLGSNQLVNRLKRIINHENKRLNKMEKIVLLAGLLIVSAFSYIPNPEQPLEYTKNSQHEVTRYIPQKKETITKNEESSEKARLIERARNIEITDTALVEKAVDTSYQFQSFRFFYSNEDLANRDMEVRDDKDNMYRVKIENGNLVSLKVNNVQIPEGELSQYRGLLAEIDQSYYAARDSKRASIERAHQYSEKNSKISELKSKDWDRAKFVKDNDFTKSKSGFVKGSKSDQLVWANGKEGDGNQVVATKKKIEPVDISADQERVRGVISELVREKVISSPSDLEWFGLSEDELVVNGNKQPAQLQQKLKERFNIKADYGLYYGPVRMIGTGIFLDKDDL
ncbi:M56 family metallopeptidase [Dyadobacter sp. CY261]|uniref:M56 family metallopeptidase n=1 Tax=Dyadobacter sp. CY261 TaxID=2907203 RepID=UPI001F2E816A|nr:M56 family metallopeptidase [Dyadobacter sp. CY261]MCF0074973.1 M56 family metallopeptidase [Dyadobacter sp. CY261]